MDRHLHLITNLIQIPTKKVPQVDAKQFHSLMKPYQLDMSTYFY